MAASELSKQKMIDTVIERKQRTVKATNEIIERLGAPQKSTGTDMPLYMKKRVNQIGSDISVIEGFCGNQEKELIRLNNEYVQTILQGDLGLFGGLLEDWCLHVNGVIVDYTKTPFRFVGGEFKINLRNLEGKIKTILKRE